MKRVCDAAIVPPEDPCLHPAIEKGVGAGWALTRSSLHSLRAAATMGEGLWWTNRDLVSSVMWWRLAFFTKGVCYYWVREIAW